MPTGYTAAVADGRISTLSDFAMRCARGMGACVTMRDDPWDKPIPEQFEPYTKYHDENIADAEAVMAEVPGLTDAECDERAEAEYQKELNRHVEREADDYAREQRYSEMIDRVERWTPRESIAGLKDFMLEHLNSGKKFDCGMEWDAPVRLTGEQWRERQLKQASRDLAYHKTERDKEIQRTEGRNEWLADLRASLPSPADRPYSASGENGPKADSSPADRPYSASGENGPKADSSLNDGGGDAKS